MNEAYFTIFRRNSCNSCDSGIRMHPKICTLSLKLFFVGPKVSWTDADIERYNTLSSLSRMRMIIAQTCHTLYSLYHNGLNDTADKLSFFWKLFFYYLSLWRQSYMPILTYVELWLL